MMTSMLYGNGRVARQAQDVAAGVRGVHRAPAKLIATFLLLLPLSVGTPAFAQDTPGRVVRIAELEIDPAQMAAYSAAVKEEMQESIRIEPGVIAIYAVSVKGNPTQLRFFEIYADQKAYEAHRDSPHFKKYVETTKNMITARKLIETDNFQLSSKSR